jgi:hypothetical protein
MASNDGAAPLARLREAVERQVSERSLRHAARQVGMSPTGLQKFLAGSAPSDATCRKLERWAFEKAAAGEPRPPKRRSPSFACSPVRSLRAATRKQWCGCWPCWSPPSTRRPPRVAGGGPARSRFRSEDSIP